MMKRVIALLATLIMLALMAAPAFADGGVNYTRDYIIPDSDTRRLTEEELWSYTRETLRYIRNELLARNGYAFTMEKFYDYFNAKPWYKAGGYNTTNRLTDVEWDNVATVKKVEYQMDKKKTQNAYGVDIQDIIAYQNSLGGFGNMNSYGQARGDGGGQAAGGYDGTEIPMDKIPDPVTPTPFYVFNKQYIIPDSDTRALTEGELWAYTRETLRYIRNELLARHGYIFGDNKFGRYFETKNWYEEGGYETAILSSLEWDNINLVKKVERHMDALKISNVAGLDITEIVEAQNEGTYPGHD